MEPYLRAGDILTYEVRQNPNFGDLVVFANGKTSIIHRYLGPKSFKGDALKRFDQEYNHDFEIQGVASHRVYKNKIVALHQGMLVRMLSLASVYNHASYAYFHRLYAATVKLLGMSLRYLEIGRE